MPLPKKKKNYFEQLVLDLATYYDNAITIVAIYIVWKLLN